MTRLLPLLLWLLLASGAHAVTELRGRTTSGAYFVAQVPDGWRAGDRLALLNHGYDIEPIDDDPSLGPQVLRERFLARGYAIAASSYSQRGWALFATERDHRELVAAFGARFGAPGAIFASGGSLGGLVAMQQAEQADLGAPVVGIYAICAPLAGSRVWEQALDIRLAYDAVCANVTGGELPRGDDAFPYILRDEDIDDYDNISGGGELVARVAKCTGHGLPSWLQTSGMRERMGRIVRATGVSEDFFLENVFYATYGLSELYRDPAKIGERAALSTRHVRYPDAIVERDIRRIDADAFASLDLKRHFQPQGRIGSARLLSTHTTRDGLVLPAHARALEGRVPADQWTRAFVAEQNPSHCGYSEAELLAGVEVLHEWTLGAPQPDAQALQLQCQRERSANPELGACRYDAAYVPPALASAIKPREDPGAPVDTATSGLWFDPARPGEGFVIEALGGGLATVTMFTYPAIGAAGDQAWFTGLGRVIDNNLVVDRFEGRRNGSFGPVFDPQALLTVALGRFDAAFSACGQGEQRVQGRPPFDSARRSLQRLTRVGAARCPGEAAPAAPSPFVRWSGAWFEPDKPGRGIYLQVQDDGRAFLVWFSFRPDGEPAWIIGEGRPDGGGLIFDALARPVGTHFGAAFDAAAVRLEHWGTARLSGDGCGSVTIDYEAAQPGYGKRRVALTRLTAPQGAGCG
ncbi:MAG: hypothetical protein DYH17_06575 [Xanthomonadales bacterium PRO6]|nr:hypothetical protein [Xanthomonadales bacterium]MCE7931021.1 hypothetical protein [Xanthomonadales bacterium PRO6]